MLLLWKAVMYVTVVRSPKQLMWYSMEESTACTLRLFVPEIVWYKPGHKLACGTHDFFCLQ